MRLVVAAALTVAGCASNGAPESCLPSTPSTTLYEVFCSTASQGICFAERATGF